MANGQMHVHTETFTNMCRAIMPLKIPSGVSNDKYLSSIMVELLI